MSNRNDFDFDFDDDDFLNDDRDPFGGDLDDDDLPGTLGDDFDRDMPVLDDEPEERGGNRTFIVLAGVMILLFIVTLVFILVRATRDTGPTDAQLTETYVFGYNATVAVYAAETSTQDLLNLQMTQTALAASPTPSPTLSPTPTTPRPTITPTPTLNLTDLANQTLAAAFILTQTAEAGIVLPEPTDEPPPADVDLDLSSAFSTEVAFATQAGEMNLSVFGTQVAIATQAAGGALSIEQERELREALQGTRSAVLNSFNAVATAVAYIETELDRLAADDPELAALIEEARPNLAGTAAALGTPAAVATIAARATQDAFATLIGGDSAYDTSGAVDEAKPNEQDADPAGTRVAQSAATVTAAIELTRTATVTLAAQATVDALSTQIAIATQAAFGTQQALSTQAALATQANLATRRALIDRALGTLQATAIPELPGVNQTATAIAGAFLTATAEAFTPEALTLTPAPLVTEGGFVLPTAIPDTGLFDDVVSGGSSGLGMLAIVVIGLVGVIVVSRRLRTTNREDEPTAPPQV